MISVYFYGPLRKLADQKRAIADSVVTMEYIPDETLSQLFDRLGISEEMTGDLFINHYLAAPHTVIPHDNSRVAIFSRGMRLIDGALYLKYEQTPLND